MHERLSLNGACFLGIGFAELSAHWRDLGAQRVGIATPHLEAESVAAARAALKVGGHSIEAIVHPFLPGQHLDPREASWETPRAKLTTTIDIAVSLGARCIYITTGGHGSMTWEQAADVFAEAVAPCARQAREAGIPLMIENAPPQYADIHLAHSLRDTVTLAELAGIGVCIDLFSCWTEAGLKDSIERAMPRCDLVQVSDYVYGDRTLPARAVPGDGDIPLARLLDWILAAGYTGAFDLELLGPRIAAEGPREAIRRAAHNTGKLLESLGA